MRKDELCCLVGLRLHCGWRPDTTCHVEGHTLEDDCIIRFISSLDGPANCQLLEEIVEEIECYAVKASFTIKCYQMCGRSINELELSSVNT